MMHASNVKIIELSSLTISEKEREKIKQLVENLGLDKKEIDSKILDSIPEILFYKIGNYFFYVKNYEQAKFFYEKLLKVNPNHVESINHLAVAELARVWPQRVAAKFWRIRLRRGVTADAISNLCVCSSKLKDVPSRFLPRQ